MALVINTNVASLNAQRQLMSSGNALDRATERLSSGARINSAKDDAAGLAISNRMTSQVRGLDQAIRNANDGVSLIQTAEGALSESTNILQRMRELAVQSANGIYTASDRATLNAEVKQLVSELDRIAKTTSFNGQNLLDGKLGNIDLQVGASANQTITLKVPAMDAKTLGMGSTSVDLMGGASDIDSLTGDLVLREGSILINGQSIIKGTDEFDGAGTGATNSDQALIDHINKNVNGVTASTYAVATATSSGDGILTSSDSVTVTLTNLDGTTAAINIGGGVNGTSSLQELVEKMNAESGGKFSVAIGDDGKVSISAENVSSIAVTGATAATALGAGITTAANARIVLKADNGDPVTVTRGSNGTLEQLNAFGFRENDKAGTVEGFAVGNGNLAAGDLKINGVDIPATTTDQTVPNGALSAKVAAINSVSDQTGVSATAFTSVSLDFGSVAVTSLAGGTFALNGVDIAITANPTSLAAVAKEFNDKTNETGITATVSGTRIVLEGNVGKISFGTSTTATNAVEDVLTDTNNVALLAKAGDESSAVAVADGDSADGGIKLTSNNGNPISVQHKDTAAQTKTGLLDSNIATGGAFGTAIASISIDTQANAQKAIKVIDNALTTISDVRSELGAVNNRLDFTVSNLANISEKTSAARSRITDADFAAETAALSRSQVLQQAATAMLAQSNARPQQVLSLLR
ncbi:flagellin N-terminal helical domain-containing protein [Cellvibrio japonicus]|uniref:Flagellin n=1 Tax=Cellvibrio japonicus (strain Ueda107) TaxID=498211 RepID=B3PGR6_CELJU|nr:flagellin [Cellvibrio japonicus]ACE85442.1 flagellin [Cellvibrio japonicus Ueda107]QEI12411.1 flagellin [Cellvibrio japonicus]QEI15984.1 flagellin [Cellvibrio japonicus]QEI19563.1 flagellin [Cellvibrio japonicus]